MLLWLWRRLAAAALIQPLAWELPYAMAVALKKKKKKIAIQKAYPDFQVFLKLHLRSSHHGSVVNESDYEP